MRRSVVMLVLLVLASCGEQGGSGETAKVDAPVALDAAEMAMEAAGMTEDAAAPAPAGAVGGAERTGAAYIAYSYDYRFELPGAKLDEVRAAHAAACEALGPARCQLLEQTRTGGAGDAVEATLTLRIAPAEARRFAGGLKAAAEKADGRLLSESMTGEDLTRQMIDAEAALKAKRTLRDRLQALLERREGKLADLLETEKALAETQQELDAATALLAELRQRVGFSAMTIGYRSEAPLIGSEARPVADALASAGQGFSESVGLLIRLVVAAVPWVVAGGLVLWLVRRVRRNRAKAAA